MTVEHLAVAVEAVPMYVMRQIVDQADPADGLRRTIVPTYHGWGNGRSYGQTRPKGYEIRLADNDDVVTIGPTVLVTWPEIARAIVDAWQPTYSALHDHAHRALRRLDDACENPIDWPRGVDDYYRILRTIHSVDEWIKDELVATVGRSDTQLAFL